MENATRGGLQFLLYSSLVAEQLKACINLLPAKLLSQTNYHLYYSERFSKLYVFISHQSIQTQYYSFYALCFRMTARLS